jgi:pimeloyl-ACP methyl ester carboxylesterase
MELSAYHPFRSAKTKEQYLAWYDQCARQWPIPSESRMVETSYGQTFVRISGALNAQPLVLLPGNGSNSLAWKANIEALSAYYQTFAVDNIYDYGRSVYTRPIKSPHDYLTWLDELINALAPSDHVNLLGISYGGWLTSQYALRFPNRLAKIVLLAPAATVLPISMGFTLRLLPCIVPYRPYVRKFLRWMFEDSVSEAVDKFADETLLAQRCFKPRAFIFPTVLKDQELRSLKVPALYLVGEHEKLYSAQKAVQRLNTIAPQIKTEIIPQAGHELIVVQAKMVNRNVLEFLKQP